MMKLFFINLLEDAQPIDEMIATFRTIRKDRQQAAHKIEEDKFDMDLLSKQRQLMKKAYAAVRTLRLILANHPNASEFSAPDWLVQGKICLY